MEYINKKWDLPTMESRMENLKKVIDPDAVNTTIEYYEGVADNRLDVLYLAYYHLKDLYCKVKRYSFGQPKSVKYNPKLSIPEWYVYGTSNGNVWWTPSDYTWTITTSTSTSSTTTAYSYNSYFNQL